MSDASMVDLGHLGVIGFVPGWPGADAFPAQPMVQQMRALLERYEAVDGAGLLGCDAIRCFTLHDWRATMTVSVTYRLDEDLKRRVSARAHAEGITETALVSRLLDEGLKVAAHPGIVYRDGPTGRRAALATGPDVWEVVNGVRHADGRGDARIADTAVQMGLPERLIRLAVNFAAAHPDEIEERIRLNEEAAKRAEALAEQQKRLLTS